MTRRVITRSSWEAKTILAEHPFVAVPITRWRGHGEIVTPETEIVIEAFARSAQSFVVAAFRLAQEPHAVRIAHHTHSPSTLIDGIRRRVPSLVIVRAPEDAILSYVIRTPAISSARRAARLRPLPQAAAPLPRPARRGHVRAGHERPRRGDRTRERTVRHGVRRVRPDGGQREPRLRGDRGR